MVALYTSTLRFHCDARLVELGTLEPTPREDAVVVVLAALLALHEKNSKCLIYGYGY